MKPPVLAARAVSKRFHRTQALAEVTFAVAPGEVHALVGENGAGKSTLIKLLAGIHQPDTGEILVHDRPVRLASPAAAQDHGIVVIPQEMRVVPALSVADNILLGDWPTRAGPLPMLDRGRMRSRAADALARLGVTLDADQPVGTLSFAERQLVMIARALGRRAQVLILDEPTASLETREVKRLFEIIARLKDEGVGIIYISHRLDEIGEIADRCTVLRDGQLVWMGTRDEIQVETLVRAMTGRDIEELSRPHDRVPGDRALVFSAPAAGAVDGRFAVLARQVKGLAGLLGSGTTELLLRLFGAGSSPERVDVAGRTTELRSPSDAIRAGIGLVPGERAQGLVMNLSIRDNILLPNLDAYGTLLTIDRKRAEELVTRVMDLVDIRPRNPDLPVRSLSGGNQQKVIFARWLAGRITVLLLDEPTHGIDIAAKTQVHRLMREFAESGGAVLFASAETHEVMNLSDSLLAMRQGRVVRDLERGPDYSEKTLRLALGG